MYNRQRRDHKSGALTLLDDYLNNYESGYGDSKMPSNRRHKSRNSHTRDYTHRRPRSRYESRLRSEMTESAKQLSPVPAQGQEQHRTKIQLKQNSVVRRLVDQVEMENKVMKGRQVSLPAGCLYYRGFVGFLYEPTARHDHVGLIPMQNDEELDLEMRYVCRKQDLKYVWVPAGRLLLRDSEIPQLPRRLNNLGCLACQHFLGMKSDRRHEKSDNSHCSITAPGHNSSSAQSNHHQCDIYLPKTIAGVLSELRSPTMPPGAQHYVPVATVIETWFTWGARDPVRRDAVWVEALQKGFIVESTLQGERCVTLGLQGTSAAQSPTITSYHPKAIVAMLGKLRPVTMPSSVQHFVPVAQAIQAWHAQGATDEAARAVAWMRASEQGYILETSSQGQRCVTLGPLGALTLEQNNTRNAEQQQLSTVYIPEVLLQVMDDLRPASVPPGTPHYTSVASVIECWVWRGATDANLRNRSWLEAASAGYILEALQHGERCVTRGPLANTIPTKELHNPASVGHAVSALVEAANPESEEDIKRKKNFLAAELQRWVACAVSEIAWHQCALLGALKGHKILIDFKNQIKYHAQKTGSDKLKKGHDSDEKNIHEAVQDIFSDEVEDRMLNVVGPQKSGDIVHQDFEPTEFLANHPADDDDIYVDGIDLAVVSFFNHAVTENCSGLDVQTAKSVAADSSISGCIWGQRCLQQVNKKDFFKHADNDSISFNTSLTSVYKHYHTVVSQLQRWYLPASCREAPSRLASVLWRLRRCVGDRGDDATLSGEHQDPLSCHIIGQFVQDQSFCEYCLRCLQRLMMVAAEHYVKQQNKATSDRFSASVRDTSRLTEADYFPVLHNPFFFLVSRIQSDLLTIYWAVSEGNRRRDDRKPGVGGSHAGRRENKRKKMAELMQGSLRRMREGCDAETGSHERKQVLWSLTLCTLLLGEACPDNGTGNTATCGSLVAWDDLPVPPSGHSGSSALPTSPTKMLEWLGGLNDSNRQHDRHDKTKDEGESPDGWSHSRLQIFCREMSQELSAIVTTHLAQTRLHSPNVVTPVPLAPEDDIPQEDEGRYMKAHPPLNNERNQKRSRGRSDQDGAWDREHKPTALYYGGSSEQVDAEGILINQIDDVLHPIENPLSRALKTALVHVGDSTNTFRLIYRDFFGNEIVLGDPEPHSDHTKTGENHHDAEKKNYHAAREKEAPFSISALSRRRGWGFAATSNGSCRDNQPDTNLSYAEQREKAIIYLVQTVFKPHKGIKRWLQNANFRRNMLELNRSGWSPFEVKQRRARYDSWVLAVLDRWVASTAQEQTQALLMALNWVVDVKTDENDLIVNSRKQSTTNDGPILFGDVYYSTERADILVEGLRPTEMQPAQTSYQAHQPITDAETQKSETERIIKLIPGTKKELQKSCTEIILGQEQEHGLVYREQDRVTLPPVPPPSEEKSQYKISRGDF